MGRDRVGGVVTSEELQKILQDWLTKYVVLDDRASTETKARYPLREGKVQILPKAGAPGSYNCVMHLVPHYQVDDVLMRVRLTTDIAPLTP
jgi:type VI secretion system protein ImpD